MSDYQVLTGGTLLLDRAVIHVRISMAGFKIGQKDVLVFFLAVWT